MKAYDLSPDTFFGSNATAITFGKGIKQKLVDNKGIILNEDLVFYSGMFLLYDQSAEGLVTLSYVTPRKKKFVLRYLSKDGTLIWKIKQSDLEIGDLFASEPTFEKAFVYSTNLIFIFDRLVFSLGRSNGHLNWITRL